MAWRGEHLIVTVLTTALEDGNDQIAGGDQHGSPAANRVDDPGKPWQNGATESFNRKFRDECLSLEWFRSRAEAKVVIESWRRHYNAVRPHSSLSYLTPAEFVAKLGSQDAASRPATGQTAAVCGALRAPTRCITVPQGASEGSTEGGVLKLGVARRNWADHRPEFVARDVREWLGRIGVKTLFVEPGSSWENGYCESFNSKLHDEVLAGEQFSTLREAKVLIEQWRRHYNAVRPHSSLGYRPPAPETILSPASAPPYVAPRPAQTLATSGRTLT